MRMRVPEFGDWGLKQTGWARGKKTDQSGENSEEQMRGERRRDEHGHKESDKERRITTDEVLQSPDAEQRLEISAKLHLSLILLS